MKSALNNEMQNQLKDLESCMSRYKGNRDIKVWNELRERYKIQYPLEIISMLDGSGYVTKWLKEV